MNTNLLEGGVPSGLIQHVCELVTIRGSKWHVS